VNEGETASLDTSVAADQVEETPAPAEPAGGATPSAPDAGAPDADAAAEASTAADAADATAESAPAETPAPAAPATPEERLQQREKQVAALERKLAHLRSWIAAINSQMAATNPQLVKNARRLYVGGVPEGTSEVRPGRARAALLRCGHAEGRAHPAAAGCAAPLPACKRPRPHPRRAAPAAAHRSSAPVPQEELYQFFAGLIAGAAAAASPGSALISCKITPEKVRRGGRRAAARRYPRPSAGRARRQGGLARA
jgi:hypothetical protein